MFYKDDGHSIEYYYPMVIKLIVANNRIIKVPVDTGSPINDIFYDCLLKLVLIEKDVPNSISHHEI